MFFRTMPLIAILAMIGCGGVSDTPPLGRVSGVVSIDGKPASNVIVTFKPKGGGRASTATTDESGSYDLSYSSSAMGAVIDTHEVTIAGLVLDYDESTPGYTEEMAKQATNPVPDEYAELKRDVEVKSGSNTANLTYP